MDYKNEENVLDFLKRSTYRAFRYEIFPSLMFMSLMLDNDTLFLDVYVDEELTEDEKDIYYAFIGEVNGDFPCVLSYETKFHVSKILEKELKHQENKIIINKYFVLPPDFYPHLVPVFPKK